MRYRERRQPCSNCLNEVEKYYPHFMKQAPEEQASWITQLQRERTAKSRM